MGRSSGRLPLAHLHRIIQVQTETINTGGITPLANTFKLSRSGNSATRAMKVNVKGQGQESNFLFFRSLGLQSYSQISARHLDFFWFWGGFFWTGSLVFC